MEKVYKEASIELQIMHEIMECMEEERAEVKAQIEHVLASMAVDVDESNYCEEMNSCSASCMSAPAQSMRDARSRRAGGAVKNGCEGKGLQPHSVGTESTLAV